MQNASQALAGALPTANAVNPSLLINLQESLKLGSLPVLAGSYLNLFRRSTRDADASWLSKPVVGSVLALVATLLVIEQVSPVRIACLEMLTDPAVESQVVYRSKKAHLPGARWTIPVIGKFADSMNPRLDNYKKQWASGALSAVSVFNM